MTFKVGDRVRLLHPGFYPHYPWTTVKIIRDGGCWVQGDKSPDRLWFVRNYYLRLAADRDPFTQSIASYIERELR